MKDKEIIIDGVNVAGCKHLECGMCTATRDGYGDSTYQCDDDDMNDCYYKQLQHKTQECKELKEYIKKDLAPHAQMLQDELTRLSAQYNAVVEQNKALQAELKGKTQECEKWKSYYDLYRLNQELLKKIQGAINSHPKYGIELTDTGIIDKDERLSSLEVHEQIKLIFDETLQECKKFRKANDEKNEFLQKLGISATGEFQRIRHYIDKLIAENEKLKEKYQEYVKTHHYNNAEFQQERNSLIQEMGYKNRYRKAIEEIGEIIDNDDWGYCPLDEREDCHGYTYLKILNIINKCKGEENNE